MLKKINKFLSTSRQYKTLYQDGMFFILTKKPFGKWQKIKDSYGNTVSSKNGSVIDLMKQFATSKQSEVIPKERLQKAESMIKNY
tara:strand:+ start:727 stop:981 length:255 start_codon:yes stop_codon:yes gene_type:complete